MGEKADLAKAVDDFSAAMKSRLEEKRKTGWTGWRGRTRRYEFNRNQLVERMLNNAVRAALYGDKECLVDVANLAMMIHRISEVE